MADSCATPLQEMLQIKKMWKLLITTLQNKKAIFRLQNCAELLLGMPGIQAFFLSKVHNVYVE